MSSVKTDPQLPDISGPSVASSQENVASQEAAMVAIRGGTLPLDYLHLPFAAVRFNTMGDSIADLPSYMLPG
jgi:hypothetical protein